MTRAASDNQTLVIPVKAVLTKFVIPAKSGIQFLLGFAFQAELSVPDAERKLLLDDQGEEKNWIPAFAGMTSFEAKPKHSFQSLFAQTIQPAVAGFPPSRE